MAGQRTMEPDLETDLDMEPHLGPNLRPDPDADYVDVEYYDAGYRDITPQAEQTEQAAWPDVAMSEAQLKKPISLRVDPEVLAFFKAQGPGYQTRINAVLRSYMLAKTNVRRP